MPSPPDQVKIHRVALACTIYANNVDISRPMLWPDACKQAFAAADKFIEYSNENEIPKEEDFMRDLTESIKTMLQAGQKIPAIKEVRTRLGWGLTEAKAFVEKVEKEPGMSPAELIKEHQKMF